MAQGLELDRARNAEAEDRYDWARIHYHNDYDARPDQIDSLRGEAFAWLSGYQQSLSNGTDRLREYLLRRPRDQEARYRLASCLKLLGRIEEARQVATELTSDPKSLGLQATLASTPAEGYRIVTDLIAGKKGSSSIYALAGRLANDRRDDEAAGTYLREAVRKNPFDHESAYLLARLCDRIGKPEEGARFRKIHGLLQEILQTGTKGALAPEQELSRLFKLERLLPPHEPARLVRREAVLSFKTGHLEEAVALTRRILLEFEPSKTEILELARMADEAGLPSFSRELFSAVLERDPNNLGAIASLAILAYRQGDLARSEELLRRGLRHDNWFARYHFLLGTVFEAMGDEANALASYRRALHLAPWKWPWRMRWLDLLLAQGRGAEFRRVLAEAPETPPGLLRYRELHAETAR